MPGVVSQKTRTTRHGLASNPPAPNVNNFAKLSKFQLLGKDTEKPAPTTGRTSSIEIVLTSRKRKVENDADSTTKKVRREPDAQRVPATPVSRKKKSVRFAELEAAPSTPTRTASTPSSSRKRRLESDETTQTEVLLERLNLQSPIRKRTKAAIAHNASQNDFDLPQELIDLLNLHVAFLKTLSMECVHHGTNSPIDLRNIYPSVTRTWGKRQVSLDDIQRCVGVLNWTPTKADTTHMKSPFFLADYGRGMVCIEFHPNTEPGPLREHKLNMDFEANLRTLWLSRRSDQAITLFIATLPKATIKACKVAPSKTQTTLADFKSSIIAQKKQEKQATIPQPTANTTTTPKLSLLDRIRARELERSQSPAGPTPAELQRRAALARAVDVAAVIGMLVKATAAGSQQVRVSFTMAAVLVRLKDSLRTPVSQEDGAVCVRLLAKEVAPQWLRVVTVGGRENVVVETRGTMGKAEVEERVRVLLR